MQAENLLMRACDAAQKAVPMPLYRHLNWKMLQVLRCVPSSGASVPTASLFAIARKAGVDAKDAADALNTLGALGFVRKFQTRYGTEYARTPDGDRRLNDEGGGRG